MRGGGGQASRRGEETAGIFRLLHTKQLGLINGKSDWRAGGWVVWAGGGRAVWAGGGRVVVGTLLQKLYGKLEVNGRQCAQNRR